MAIITRQWNITDGQKPTASQPNSEFDNIQNGMNTLNEANILNAARLSGSIFRDAGCDSSKVGFGITTAVQTVDLVLTNVLQDVPGCTITITPTIPVYGVVFIQAHFKNITSVTNRASAYLNLNGDLPDNGNASCTTDVVVAVIEAVVSQVYLVELRPNVASTLKMQALSRFGGGNLIKALQDTQISVWEFAI